MMREENVKHFRLPKGTYEAVAYAPSRHGTVGLVNSVLQKVENFSRKIKYYIVEGYTVSNDTLHPFGQIFHKPLT